MSYLTRASWCTNFGAFSAPFTLERGHKNRICVISCSAYGLLTPPLDSALWYACLSHYSNAKDLTAGALHKAACFWAVQQNVSTSN